MGKRIAHSCHTYQLWVNPGPGRFQRACVGHTGVKQFCPSCSAMVMTSGAAAFECIYRPVSRFTSNLLRSSHDTLGQHIANPFPSGNLIEHSLDRLHITPAHIQPTQVFLGKDALFVTFHDPADSPGSLVTVHAQPVCLFD